VSTACSNPRYPCIFAPASTMLDAEGEKIDPSAARMPWRGGKGVGGKGPAARGVGAQARLPTTANASPAERERARRTKRERPAEARRSDQRPVPRAPRRRTPRCTDAFSFPLHHSYGRKLRWTEAWAGLLAVGLWEHRSRHQKDHRTVKRRRRDCGVCAVFAGDGEERSKARRPLSPTAAGGTV